MSSHRRPGTSSRSSDPLDSHSTYVRSTTISSIESSPEPVKLAKRKNKRSRSPEPSRPSIRKHKNSSSDTSTDNLINSISSSSRKNVTSVDKTVVLHNIRSPTKKLHTFKSHTDEVLHLTVGITWASTIAIACHAFLGKFGGCTITSRLSGFSWRESSTIGALMSCKGLVELIVLNVGLSTGILSPRVFFMFVLEALTLAFMTTPLITALYPPERRLITTAPPQTRDDECRDFDANKKSLVNEEQPWQHRFTVILDRIEHMPCMMAPTQLVRPPIPDFSSTSAASYPTPSKHKTPEVSISALRLIELSNRISAVMKSSIADTLTHTDLLLNIFRMFGELNDLPVSTSLTIVLHDDIPTLLQYLHLLQVIEGSISGIFPRLAWSRPSAGYATPNPKPTGLPILPPPAFPNVNPVPFGGPAPNVPNALVGLSVAGGKGAAK
ncbi:hypothetical protein P692DRAFT_20952852 [Suillus brevipes Sb2]|nr:hypothetical protein P692DRAFT_20952852 [Suillus brevipes Sb2]